MAGVERTFTPRDERLWLLAILLLGFLLRAAYLVELTGQPDFAHPTAIDADYHDDWAIGLATGIWSERLNTEPSLRDMAYFRPPGYAYFLAGVFRVFGHDYFAVRVVQMAMGLGTCLLVWRLGRLWYGPQVGLAGAAIAATYWPLIYYEAELHEAFLLVFLATAALLALSKQVARPSMALGLCGGLLMGTFAVVRPNLLFFVPVATAWCWWVGRKATCSEQQGEYARARSKGSATNAESGISRFLKLSDPRVAAAGIVVGTMLPIAPVTLRNYVVSGEFVLISSNAGMQLLISNHREATGLGDGYLPNLEELTGLDGWTTYDIPRIHQGVERKVGRRLTSSDVSRYFTQEVLKYIREQPLDWLALMGRKVLFYWGPIELDSNKELHYARQESVVLRSIPVGFTPVLAGAVVGTAIVMRSGRRRGEPSDETAESSSEVPVGPMAAQADHGRERGRNVLWNVTILLLLFVLSYWLSFAAFSVTTRYRLPLLPALGILCGVTAVTIWRQAAISRTRALVFTLGTALALGVILSVRYVPYEPDLAKWHFFRGAAWERAGRLEEAATRYVQSAEIDSQNPRTHFALGSVLLRLGQADAALRHWDEAARIKPDYPGVHVNRAGVLAGMGRTDEAFALLRRAIEQGVQEDAVYGQLAALLEVRGSRDEARAVLEGGLGIHPESARLLTMLGRLEARDGLLGPARASLEQAVALEPDLAPARINLGLVYKELGRTDDAIAQYQAVLAATPDDVHARHNLGVALAAGGRWDEAIAEFRAVIAARPDLHPTRVELAEALRRSGQFEPALTQLTEALRVAPDSPAARLSLARTLAALHRGREAVDAFERYLELGPADEAAKAELAGLLDSLGEADRANPISPSAPGVQGQSSEPVDGDR